ncbi:MAG: tetratricopeptide repeat protein [Candidatus Latescibacteria bacterium]|nr:tetratricopeptide repeat protein [Candidatus Latescibacterota bacterium]
MSKTFLSKSGSKNLLVPAFSMFSPLLLIGMLGGIIYSNSFDCSFHFDDYYNITENNAIRNIENVNAIWNFINRRFVGIFTFALNYHFHHLDVFGYHVFNVVIHIASSFLVWWLVILTLSTPVMQKERISTYKRLLALGCGLLFLSHPVQTQAVTYIVQRVTSLASLFYFASLCFYLKARLTEKKYQRILLFLSSALTALLGIFTKEIVITLPFSILLYEIYFLRTEDKSVVTIFKKKKFWLSLIPFVLFILIIPYLFSFKISSIFVTVSSQRHLDPPLTPVIYFMTQFRVIPYYIKLLFVPLNQNLDYDFPASLSFFEPYTFLGFLFLAALIFTAIRMFSRYRLASFGILWFFLTLSVEAIKPLGNVIFEHRLYLPMFGFSLFFVSILYHLFRERNARTAVIFFTALIIFFSILTYERNKVWKDDITLWSDVVKKSPDKARPYLNLGRAFYHAEKDDDAINHYRNALRLNPQYTDAYNNLGNALVRQGKIDESITEYRRALSLDPYYPELYSNLGAALYRQGKTEEAIQVYQKALSSNIRNVELHFNLGLALSKQGKLERAVEHLKNALDIEPGYETHYLMGLVLKKQGKTDEAIEHILESVRIKPDNIEGHIVLSQLYAFKGETEKARSHSEEADRLRKFQNKK